MTAPTVLIVTELEADGVRHAAALDGLADLHVRCGTEAILATYLELRPDLVVLDLLTDPEEAPAVIRQLATIGFRNTPVPFVVVVDDAAGAELALVAGARDTVRRDEAGTAAFGRRVANALTARDLQVRVRAQRHGLADVVLATRASGAA